MSVNHKLQGWIMLMSAVLLMPLTAAARWISVDPKAGKYPNSSPYVYASDNPMKFVDPDGRETRIYSLPIVAGTKHLFIVVKNSKTFTSKGFYPQSRTAAILNMFGAGLNSGNKVVLKTDLASELGEVRKLEAGKKSNAELEATITPPEGVSEDDYDKTVLKTVNNFSTEDVDYNVTGPNSNTMVDNVIEETGAAMPDVKGAVGQNHGESDKPTPEPQPPEKQKD